MDTSRKRGEKKKGRPSKASKADVSNVLQVHVYYYYGLAVA